MSYIFGQLLLFFFFFLFTPKQLPAETVVATQGFKSPGEELPSPASEPLRAGDWMWVAGKGILRPTDWK